MQNNVPKRRTSWGLTPWLGLFLSLILCSLGRVAAAQIDIAVSGHIVVRIKPGVAISELNATYRTYIVGSIASQHIFAVHTPQGTSDARFAQAVGSDPRVVYALRDMKVTFPEVRGSQFHLAFDAGPNPGDYVNQYAYQQVNLGAAASRSTGQGVIVAILDTGATFDHPALRGHYLPGFNVIDPAQPPNDVADGTSNIAVGHGTMIAGIVARIAPDAKIMPVKVLTSNGIGTLFNVLCGMYYAVENNAQVLNMSMSADQSSPAMRDALEVAYAAGVLVVASAGNEGEPQVSFPAAYPHVIAVTSVEQNNRKSTYANCGQQIGVVAPGTGIRSTYVNGGYASWSGTSFAAPFASGEAALVFALNPSLDNDDVSEIVCRTSRSVDRLNPQYLGMLGFGLIDINAAVYRGN